ncbi:ankyrin repeat-containing domain protein [Xylariaceae sp. FL1019]|nr:ankyrin repeat-containing domain protein [Xylariaceae sp. FL1019]
MDLAGVPVPTEIVEEIVSYAIKDDWNDEIDLLVYVENYLELRLVCRLFNQVVSRQALRKVARVERHSGARGRMNPATVAWLLATKIKYRLRAKEGFAAYIRVLANEMAIWKQCNSCNCCNSQPGSAEQQEHDFITAACSLLVAVKGRLWAFERLQRSFKSSTDDLLLPHKGQSGGLDTIANLGGLQVASWCGDESITRGLLEHGIDADHVDENFGHSLFAAARNGHTRIAKLLIDAGASSDGVVVDHFETTYSSHPTKEHLRFAPYVAEDHRHSRTERYLMERCVQLNSPVSVANKALLYASQCGALWAVRMALQRPDIDVNTVTPYAQATPLILAALRGHEDIGQMLLERHDIQVNAQDSHFQNTALHTACRFKLSNLATQLLLHPDIDPNIRNSKGETALTIAVLDCDEAIVETLLERPDVDPGLQNEQFNPLQHAILEEHYDIAEAFLRRTDISLATVSFQGQSILWWAVFVCDEYMVRLLLNRPDVNPNFGPSALPLMQAVQNDHVEMVQHLLARPDLDPNLIRRPLYSNQAMTALAYACRRGFKDVATLLLEDARTIPDISVSPDLSPLWCAAAEGHDEIVQLLLRDNRVSPEALFRHPDIDRRFTHPVTGITASTMAERMGLHHIVAQWRKIARTRGSTI